MGAFKIFRKFSQLLDRTTVDLPAINTPLADALDAKANSADLGSIATFEGDQNLRTTDPATFTDLTASGTVTAGTITANGNLTVNPTGAVKVEKSGTPQFTFGGGSGNYTYRDFYTISGNQLGLSGLRWGSAWMTNIDASGTVSAADVSATGNIQATTKLTVGTGLDFITGRTDYGIGVVLSTVSGNRRNLFVGKGLLDEGAVVMRAGGFLGWSGNFANADFSVGDLRLYRHGISELGIGTATTTNGGSLSLANLTASGTVTAGVAGAGSYLTPTLTVGDANTGFYHSATNRMGFSVAATKCFNIYSRGLYMETGFALGASSSQWMRSGASGIEFASLNTGGSLIDISMANLTASGTVTLDGLARPSWTYAPVTDTSTARSLTIAADLWKRLRFSNVGAITITVPENSTQAFPIGYTIPIRRVAGAGAITIAVAGGVTVNGSAGSTSVPAGGDFALHKIATDTWDFI